jgi:hypothetical protein
MRPGTLRIFRKNSIFSSIDRIAKGAADVTAGQLIGREASEGVNGDP